MIRTKDLAIMGLYVALLIGTQLILSGISGVELVTVLLLCFSFVYGAKKGIIVAITFSVLRCFVFGFNINVLLLYLIYYPLFSLFFGFLGGKFSVKLSVLRYIFLILMATLFTACFTLLDNVLTPIIYGYSLQTAKIYFIASLYTLFPQIICTIVSVSTLFYPITRVLKIFSTNKKEKEQQ